MVTELKVEEVMTLFVQCEPHMEVGCAVDGVLRVIPIIGGEVSGKVVGKVISGGADWNTEKLDGYGHVFAKYMIQAEDGTFIAIENEGIIHPSNEKNFIKTSPRFTVKKGSKYDWLNHGVFVGTLESGPVQYSVIINVYKLL